MKIKYILGSLLLAAGLTSCNDFLDTMPDNRTQLDTDEKIKELLVNAYPNHYFAMLTELASDNTDDNGSTYSAMSIDQTEAATWKDFTQDGDDSPYYIWDSFYKAIATANQALLAIENAGNPASLAPQKGEALLCRAYCHFILTNIFCQNYNSKTSQTDPGVPYITKPETTVAPQYSRGTVAEDYAQIAKDLEEGLPLIDDGSYSVPAYHFNKKAAYAFATRFYLYYMQDDKSNLDKAISYATEVLTSNPANVLCKWSTIGALTPNDDVRSNAFMSTENNANLLTISTYSNWSYCYGPYSLGMKYTHNNKICTKETAKASGPWGTLYFWVPQYLGNPKEIMGKMSAYFEYTDPVNGIGYLHTLFPAFTTDETLLDRAEAYTLKGEYDKAMADMNVFTHNFTSGAPAITSDLINSYYGTGAGAYAYYTPTEPTPKKKIDPDFQIPAGSEMYIQALLHMRRILTLHEGWRWFDIKRYGITIYRRIVQNGNGAISVYDTMDKNDPRRAIQLPQEVISAGIEANPRNK